MIVHNVFVCVEAKQQQRCLKVEPASPDNGSWMSPGLATQDPLELGAAAVQVKLKWALAVDGTDSFEVASCMISSCENELCNCLAEPHRICLSHMLGQARLGQRVVADILCKGSVPEGIAMVRAASVHW